MRLGVLSSNSFFSSMELSNSVKVKSHKAFRALWDFMKEYFGKKGFEPSTPALRKRAIPYHIEIVRFLLLRFLCVFFYPPHILHFLYMYTGHYFNIVVLNILTEELRKMVMQSLILENLHKEMSPTFTRKTACKLLGGLFTSGTLANLDSLGTGPGCIHAGKRVLYERESFLTWLGARFSAKFSKLEERGVK